MRPFVTSFLAPERNPEIPNFALRSPIEQRGESIHAARKHSYHEREAPHQETNHFGPHAFFCLAKELCLLQLHTNSGK
ncbi:uncharacterized protein WM294_005891 isoform 2-T2 [Sarcoramphus papa]